MDTEERKTNLFVDQLNKYQSANSSSASIKANFIIRQTDFELIIADLKNKKKNDPLQHELLLGRRGSGKSTLLKRIQIEIEEDPQLAKKYIAINLAEEQAGVYRLFDLWLEVLKELQNRTSHAVVFKDYSSFDDDQAYARYLYAAIHEVLEKEQRKVVLLLDNLDRIVENFHDDGNLLREILLNYNDIQIIGGSTRMDEHFWRYDKPFYEFFRRHRLEGLSSGDMHKLLNHWSEVMGLPQLKEFTRQEPGKIEAIRILTDGLPRTLQFFTQILIHDSTLYGFDYVRKVMDDMTPLYQERLNNLPPPQRKIVLEMAFLWEACSVKQVAEKCSMKSNVASAQLKHLSKNGLVELITTSKRNHLYRLTERFFNMWLIVTQGNPEQKRKARWLTIFLENWYDGQQLKTLAAKHTKALELREMPFDRAVLLTKAFAQSRYITTGERDVMLDYTMQLNPASITSVDFQLPEKYIEIQRKIQELIDHGNYLQAHKLTDEIENEGDGIKFFIKGILCEDEGRLQETEQYYLRAIQQGNVKALYNLALLYQESGSQKEAEEYYLRAIEKGDVNALNNLAHLYRESGSQKEAEEYYLRAIEKGDVNALYNLAHLYQESRSQKEAEGYYLRAIEKGHVSALYNLALLYEDSGSQKEAEGYYLRAIEKGHVNALYNLANLYEDSGSQKEAEGYYLRAMEKGHVSALNNLALLYYKTNSHKEDALRLIIEHNEKDKTKFSVQLKIIVEIWNGIFDDIENKMEDVIRANGDDDLSVFFIELLILEQVGIVSYLFENTVHGEELLKRYELIHYAILLLKDGVSSDDVQLRIPPEVMPAVQEIVEEVKEKRSFYAKPAKKEL